ncbi:hypothetical protein [Sinomonas mesophila]|uniref:hypothetical protein n=1 Tax=Sinomonas mesophila TaxID=1531955 RepID=UPI001115A26D|nr:hypothetical protein [Sinomonas mesophila]
MGASRWPGLRRESHPATPEHVHSCPECRGRLEARRRYLAALREADIPRASSCLQERLLRQTQHLAAQAELAEASVQRRSTGALRAGLSVLAGTAAAVAALAVTAYGVAGDPPARGSLKGTEASFVVASSSLARVGVADGGAGAQAAGGPAASAGAGAPLLEDPVERIGRGLRIVFGASCRP